MMRRERLERLASGHACRRGGDGLMESENRPTGDTCRVGSRPDLEGWEDTKVELTELTCRVGPEEAQKDEVSLRGAHLQGGCGEWARWHLQGMTARPLVILHIGTKIFMFTCRVCTYPASEPEFVGKCKHPWQAEPKPKWGRWVYRWERLAAR